jgi:hypothetical protein
MFSNTVLSQAKSGVENYSLLSRGENYVWMPVIHYQSKKGIYAELRYNYEDLNTVSVYGGKTFAGGKTLQFSVTPMVGFAVGQFNGVSIATNTEVEWRSIYLSSQTQYSIATQVGEPDFFFTWSELGYNISRHLYGGFAIQYTKQQAFSDTEPGIVLGFNFRNFSIPVYAFSPLSSNPNFIIGLNYVFNF